MKLLQRVEFVIFLTANRRRIFVGDSNPSNSATRVLVPGYIRARVSLLSPFNSRCSVADVITPCCFYILKFISTSLESSDACRRPENKLGCRPFPLYRDNRGHDAPLSLSIVIYQRGTRSRYIYGTQSLKSGQDNPQSTATVHANDRERRGPPSLRLLRVKP